MRKKIRIYTSTWSTPGEIVAVEDRQVAWAGSVSRLGEAGDFDALFCNDRDEAQVRHILREAGIESPQ
jgi:hypothetical protein